MTPRWFAYERSLRGWTPVVFHGSKPTNDANSFKVERTPLVEVPDDCIMGDGEPSFRLLTERFPAP